MPYGSEYPLGSEEYFQDIKNQRAGVGGPPGGPPGGSPATALAGGAAGSGLSYLGTGGTAALRRKLLMRRMAAQASGGDNPLSSPIAPSPFGARSAQPMVQASGVPMPGGGTIPMPPILGGPGTGPGGNPIPQNPQNPGGPVAQNPNYPGGLQGALERLRLGQGNKDEFLNIIQYLLAGQTAPGTIFSPGGSAASLEAARSNATQTADALARRNALTARASGATPSGLGYANLMSQLNGQGEIASSVNSSLDRNSQLYDDLLRQLFTQAAGYNYNQGNIESQGIWNRRAAGAGQGGTDWASLLGQLGAAGITAAF